MHRYGTGTYFFTMRVAVSSKDSNFSIFLGDIRIRTGLPRVYVNGKPRLPGLRITRGVETSAKVLYKISKRFGYSRNRPGEAIR